MTKHNVSVEDLVVPDLVDAKNILTLLCGGRPGPVHSTEEEAHFSNQINQSGVLHVAQQLTVYLDGAELLGREGPTYLPGGYISCYVGEGGNWSFNTASRPLLLESKADVPYGVLEQRVVFEPDETLSFSVHLWPSQSIDLCFFAACMSRSGCRIAFLVGPGFITPLPAAAEVTFKLLFTRDRDFHFDLESSVFSALGEIVKIPGHPQDEWENILLVEMKAVEAVRCSQNDLFSDMWAMTRCFMALTALRSDLAAKPD